MGDVREGLKVGEKKKVGKVMKDLISSEEGRGKRK